VKGCKGEMSNEIWLTSECKQVNEHEKNQVNKREKDKKDIEEYSKSKKK
jgi:hypothetical protein